MGFHIEPVVYAVRGGEEFKVFGDKYKFVLLIQSFNNIAMISLANGEMPTEDREEFRTALLKMGFKMAIWTRANKKNLLWQLEENKLEVI